MADTLIAADLIKTAGPDPSIVSRDLRTFAQAIPDRGPGCRGPQRLSLAPLYAVAAVKNGGFCDHNVLTARRTVMRLGTPRREIQMWRIVNRV